MDTNIKPLIKTVKTKFFKVNPTLIVTVEDIKSVQVVPGESDLLRIEVVFINRYTKKPEKAFFHKRRGNDQYVPQYATKMCDDIFKELTL